MWYYKLYNSFVWLGDYTFVIRVNNLSINIALWLIIMTIRRIYHHIWLHSLGLRSERHSDWLLCCNGRDYECIFLREKLVLWPHLSYLLHGTGYCFTRKKISKQKKIQDWSCSYRITRHLRHVNEAAEDYCINFHKTHHNRHYERLQITLYSE